MAPLCHLQMTLPGGYAGVLGMTVRLMTDQELARLEVLRDLDRKTVDGEAAAQLLRLERRQVFRLLKAYRAAGAPRLISKRRGRPGNWRRRSWSSSYYIGEPDGSPPPLRTSCAALPRPEARAHAPGTWNKLLPRIVEL